MGWQGQLCLIEPRERLHTNGAKKVWAFLNLYLTMNKKYLLEMDEQLLRFTGKDVKEMAFQLAEKNNLTHPMTNQEAGQDWLLGFLKRHPK